MLNAIGAPLISSDFCKNAWSIPKELVDDVVFGRLFKILKSMLFLNMR
jgi:hypothetical protein